MSAPRPITPEQEERLARYLAGEMAPAEREAFEGELLAHDELADALYAQIAIAAVPPDRAAGTAPEALPHVGSAPRDPLRGATPPRRAHARRAAPAWAIALPLAAAVVATILLVRPGLRPPGNPTGEVRGLPATPRPIAPAGPLEALPARFSWSPSAGAVRYRVEVFDERGRLVATDESAATSLELAPSTLPATLARARWHVVSLDTEGRTLAVSAPAEFRIARR